MSVQAEENLKTTKATLISAKLGWKEWCENLHPENSSYQLMNREGVVLCDTNAKKTGSKIEDLSEQQEVFTKNFVSRVDKSELVASLKISENEMIQKIIPMTSFKNDLNRFDRVIFFKIVPFAFFSYLMFLLFFYYATKPLGGILTKVKQLKIDLPFNKNLQLFYKKDE